jgi:hypothetical protein
MLELINWKSLHFERKNCFANYKAILPMYLNFKIQVIIGRNKLTFLEKLNKLLGKNSKNIEEYG